MRRRRSGYGYPGTTVMINTLKKLIPRISETERIALACGSVTRDGEIFKGEAPKHRLADWHKLSCEEGNWIHDHVYPLIELQDRLGYVNNDLHPDVWKYLKDHRFFSINIPKAYGGLEFSPLANSIIVTEISNAGFISLAVTVMVPNSLGPAELLMHYGTKEQQLRYLPRLAEGAIPCFALTGPRNGSDATGQMDVAYPIEDDGYHVVLDKRYITLAPVADLIGLAVNVAGKGITVFLIERDHLGLEIGERHDPLGQPFMNGPIRGTIKLTDNDILGGPDMLGRGWEMLVACLSVGRAISLPGLSVGVAKLTAEVANTYSDARIQFKLPIGKMQAVQEVLCDINYQTNLLVEVQKAINGELLAGESPAVLSGMWKYQSTERARKVINAGMDIQGGAGIQRGKNNTLAEPYTTIPIAITVEGANILTRSLIAFGQGLVRSHPHVFPLIEAVDENDSVKFNKHLFGMVGHASKHFLRSVFLRDKKSLFAFTADMCLTLGGAYKKSGRLSSRMADIFFIRYCEGLKLDGYTFKRLANEERTAYRDLVIELPTWTRPLMRMAMWSLDDEYQLSSKDNAAYLKTCYKQENLFINTTGLHHTRMMEGYTEVNSE